MELLHQALDYVVSAADADVFFGEVATSLERDDAVVEVHGERGAGEVGGREFVAGPVGVELVDELLAELHEGTMAADASAVLIPVGGVEVFYEVNAVFGCAGVEVAKGFHDVSHLVAAVVEDDVRGAELVEEGWARCGL